MRPSTKRVLTVGTVAGIMIGSITVAQASMASLTSPTGPDSGNLSTSPTTFFAGDTITITANFADSQSGKVITFYKETSPGSGQYDSIGTKTANSSGNGSLTGYTINGQQKVFARTSALKETEVDTLTPNMLAGDAGVISACFDRDDGDLSLLFAGKVCSSAERLLTWNQQGEKGDQGDQGDKGDKGDPGPSGSSQAFEAEEDFKDIDGGSHQVLAKQLPAGKYVVTAKLQLVNEDGFEDRRISCGLSGLGASDAGETFVKRRLASSVFKENLVLMDAFATSEAGQVQVNCVTHTDHPVAVTDVKLIVMKVDSIG